MSKTLLGAFNKISKQIENAQTVSVKKMSEDTKETMSRYTPVETGALLESLDVTSITKNRFIVEYQQGYHNSLFTGENVYIPEWLSNGKQIEGWYKATGRIPNATGLGFIEDYNIEIKREIKDWYIQYMRSQGINAK